jgi:hypothetical protein
MDLELGLVWGCIFRVEGLTASTMDAVDTAVQENGASWFDQTGERLCAVQLGKLRKREPSQVVIGVLGAIHSQDEVLPDLFLDAAKKMVRHAQKKLSFDDFVGYFADHGAKATLIDETPTWYLVASPECRDGALAVAAHFDGEGPADLIPTDDSAWRVGVSILAATPSKAVAVELTIAALARHGEPLVKAGASERELCFAVIRTASAH